MHRFHLPADSCQNPVLTLPEREAHHALQVLRLQTGDAVEVLDGQGHRLHCRLTQISRRSLELSVLRRETASPLPYQATLFQAVTKGKSMDWIVQKAAELGVARLVPVLTERSVPQVAPGETERKADKWRTIAVEAIKQCGSPWLPQIDEPRSLREVLTTLDQAPPLDLAFVGSLQPGARHPRPAIHDFQATHGRPPVTVAIWVGPEGDFAPGELDQILSRGVIPITLGPLVLRAETAAVYGLSFLSYELQSPPTAFQPGKSSH